MQGLDGIYGLGKVVEFMLLGKTFYDAEGIPSDKDFERFKIPKKTVSVLRKATHEKPNQRYNSVDDFYNALEASIKGTSLQTTKASSRKTSSGSLESRLESVELSKREIALSLGKASLGALAFGTVGALITQLVGKALDIPYYLALSGGVSASISYLTFGPMIRHFTDSLKRKKLKAEDAQRPAQIGGTHGWEYHEDELSLNNEIDEIFTEKNFGKYFGKFKKDYLKEIYKKNYFWENFLCIIHLHYYSILHDIHLLKTKELEYIQLYIYHCTRLQAYSGSTYCL